MTNLEKQITDAIGTPGPDKKWEYGYSDYIPAGVFYVLNGLWLKSICSGNVSECRITATEIPAKKLKETHHD